MKKLAIIVLGWNKLETTTKLFLDSLYQYTDEKIFDLIFDLIFEIFNERYLTSL